MSNQTQIDLGIANRERVRLWLMTHLGGRQNECARDLDLSLMAVNRHFRAIRSEWLGFNIRKEDQE